MEGGVPRRTVGGVPKMEVDVPRREGGVPRMEAGVLCVFVGASAVNECVLLSPLRLHPSFPCFPTILHVLCLTDTAIRRRPLVAVLGQGEGAQPGAGGALAARGLRLVQAAVVAALQRSLVGVLGLAHHREGHTAERLQDKPHGRASLSTL